MVQLGYWRKLFLKEKAMKQVVMFLLALILASCGHKSSVEEFHLTFGVYPAPVGNYEKHAEVAKVVIDKLMTLGQEKDSAAKAKEDFWRVSRAEILRLPQNQNLDLMVVDETIRFTAPALVKDVEDKYNKSWNNWSQAIHVAADWGYPTL